MDRSAAARALTTRAARPAPRRLLSAAPRVAQTYAFDVAGADDARADAAIRRLLRESVFGGDVRLSLEREPDSRLAATIDGDVHETIVARHQVSGEVAAIACRAVRDAFLNGTPARLGYLGLLRIDPRFRRHRGLLDAGFAFCRRLHESDGLAAPRLYLASVVADNEAARRLLARRAPDWPSFEPIDTLTTLAIPVRQLAAKPANTGVRVIQGTSDLAGDIAACLDVNGRQAQFFPRWTAGDLTSAERTRGLTFGDFAVAVRGNRVVGCAACWDQRQFKQIVVRGYSPRLGAWRPLLNAIAPLTGTPMLPAVDRTLEGAYVSHLAVSESDVDRAQTAEALVRAVGRRAREKGLDYVMLGLSARSPLVDAFTRRLRHRAYESVLYVAFWPEGESAAAALDGRPANPELAIL